MRTLSGRKAEDMVKRLSARGTSLHDLEPLVQKVIDGVRRGGDRSLRRYAERWDRLARNQSLQVPEQAMRDAWDAIPTALRKSLREAAGNIRAFCEWQRPRSWTRTRAGISLGQIVQPLESVGCYVPGGRYPLVSTLLMTV